MNEEPSDAERRAELEAKVPSEADLDLITIQPPKEWLEEPSWE